MFLAIRYGVEQNVNNVKNDGFSLSLVGKQDVRFFKLPILTSPDDEVEQPVTINLPKSNEN